MRIEDSPIAFINCHLAAGQRHTRRRNADLVNIFESVLFAERADSITKLDESSTTDAAPSDAFAGGGDGAMILPDHELVFVAGDLNCEFNRCISSTSSCIVQR